MSDAAPTGDEAGARLAADGLPPIGAMLAAAGLAPRKALGQNFLLDLNLTRRIARAAVPLDVIVEVGPGPGGLTRALLLEGARHVVAIERDPRCLPILEEIGARWPGRLTVLEADALRCDPRAHFPPKARAQVVANLPYNIGTELLVRWLRGDAPERRDPPAPWWAALTLMFQREVGERIVAKPETAAYGRLALLAAYRASPRILFDVAPKAFTPPPKVVSSVVRIEPHAQPAADCTLIALERVTAAVFSQRRKMLRSSLKSVFADPLAVLGALGVDPRRRPETLTLAEAAGLARHLEAEKGPR